MVEAPRYVVDASVASKWYLDDEEYGAQADAILGAYQQGAIQLLAPGHLRYEVSSAIRNALRTRRLSTEQIYTRISDFLAWDIPTVDSSDLILAGLGQAFRFGCSLYDGIYLALAEATRCPLLYADVRLRNVLGELWLVRGSKFAADVRGSRW